MSENDNLFFAGSLIQSCDFDCSNFENQQFLQIKIRNWQKANFQSLMNI